MSCQVAVAYDHNHGDAVVCHAPTVFKCAHCGREVCEEHLEPGMKKYCDEPACQKAKGKEDDMKDDILGEIAELLYMTREGSEHEWLRGYVEKRTIPFLQQTMERMVRRG